MNEFWMNVLTSSIVVVAFIVVFLAIYAISSASGMKKRRQYVKKFQESLKPGKKVVLTGGLVGKIVKMGEEYLTIEIAKGLTVSVSRFGVQEVVEEN